MAPNYGVVLPIAETVDRRGQNMNMGIGDANLSWLGAAVEGYQTGAANQLNIETRRLELQDKYNPDRLFEEQLQRELKTRQLQAAVEEAEKKLPFIEREAEARIQAVEAGTGLTREQTRAADIKSDIAEKYGERAALTDIQLKETQMAKARSDMAARAYKLQFGSKETEAEKMKLWTRLDSTERLELKEADTKQKNILSSLYKKDEFLARTRQQNLLDKTNRTPEQERDLEKLTEQLNKLDASKAEVAEIEGRYEKLRVKFGIDLSAEPGEAINPRQAQIQTTLNDAQSITQKAALDQEALLATVAGLDAKTNSRYVSKETIRLDNSLRAKNGIDEAVADRDAAGNVNYPAARKDLEEVIHHYEKIEEPDVKRASGELIKDAIEGLGGMEQLVNYGTTLRDKEDRDRWNETLARAAIASGNIQELAPEQRDLLQAGLPPEEAARPDDTLKEIGKLIANNPTSVKSPSISALQFNEIVNVARDVSQNGRLGFSITTSSGDINNQEQQPTKQRLIMFTNSDGDKLQLNEADYAMQDPRTGRSTLPADVMGLINSLNRVGGESSENAVAKQGGQINAENVERTSQSAIQKVPTPAPINAQPAPTGTIQQPEPVDSKGYTIIDGERKPASITKYRYLEPSDIGTPGMQEDLLRSMGVAAATTTTKNSLDRYFNSLAARGEYIPQYGKQLAEDIINAEWATVSKSSSDKAFWERIGQQETQRRIAAGYIGGARVTGERHFKETLKNNLQPTIDDYAHQVVSRYKLYEEGLTEQAAEGRSKATFAIEQKLAQPDISAKDRVMYTQMLRDL